MIARARITHDERFYRTFYADWVRHRSKFRKFAPIFATAFLLGGILLVCLGTGRRSRVFGFCLVAIGIGYVIDVLTYEGRWVRRRLRAGGSSSAHIEFHE